MDVSFSYYTRKGREKQKCMSLMNNSMDKRMCIIFVIAEVSVKVY